MTSFTSPPASRRCSTSSPISLGPMPSSGERWPMRTKYRPLYASVCSIISRSPGVSTTHSCEASRLGEAHSEHSSSSAKVLHLAQRRTLLSARDRDSASLPAPVLSCCSRWYAVRCADFGPMPGMQRSASISSSSAGDFIAWRLEGQLESRRKAHAARERAHLLLHRGLDLARGVVHRRRDQVLEHLPVGAEQGRVDLHALDVVLAGHRDLHHPGAGLALDLDRGELVLELLHVLLHALGLLHQARELSLHHRLLLL